MLDRAQLRGESIEVSTIPLSLERTSNIIWNKLTLIVLNFVCSCAKTHIGRNNIDAFCKIKRGEINSYNFLDKWDQCVHIRSCYCHFDFH